VLLVEDSERDALLTARELRRSGYVVTFERVQDASGMRAALDNDTWDLVLSDWSMPTFSALAALSLLKERNADVPFIVVSGTVGEETAIAALHAGARDFVVKGSLARLVPAVERELRGSEARLRVQETLHLTEEKLRQSQKMEAVGRLAGGVAHDFNNALSVVLCYADIIAADLKAGDPLRADVEEIRLAATRAADLTRQLLAFSRQQVLAPRILDLNQVVVGMSNMLRRLLGADVDLEVLPSASLWNVKADPGQMEQVLMNLVVNARDAMPSGGRLTIETKNLELPASGTDAHHDLAPGPYVVLAITDNGIGMDSETQAQIFEPFFTTKRKGSGLGLSTVFGIVRQSGGQIAVDSAPGVGTTFKVFLPKNAGATELRPSDRPMSVSGGGTETILLVEDDEQVRVVACGILRRSGYRVLEAPNGGEALLLCERHEGTIDLLLTDVVLPRMSGRELSERLAGLRSGMKVLFVSGYTDDSVMRHGILDSDVAYLQKPFTPATLTKKVRELLDT
jgi:two-component system cell cycle sensor histidine kinase/response regulator CckA